MVCLIAPDSFKGSLTASEAARAMARGVRAAAPNAEVIELPIADGGEGTVEVLINAKGGTIRETRVAGPLGRMARALWGVLGDGKTAVIEMAAASGITLLSDRERQVRTTTTYGTGELLRAALDAGAQKIIVGIGGSATNDGGAGMAEALGVRFYDQDRRPLKRGGEALRNLAHIDFSGSDQRLKQVEIIAACDVENPLCGPAGASAVFGPQKGATPADVEILDRALEQYGKVIRKECGMDVFALRGGGAAGGLGVGLVVFCGAKLLSGIDLILDIVDFDRYLKRADVVLTGEGTIDSQMKFGKALAGVLRSASRHSVPVLGVAGVLEGRAGEYCREGLFTDVVALTNKSVSREDAMRDAAMLLSRRTQEIVSRWVRKRPTWE